MKTSAESFESPVSGSSEDIESVVTELGSHDGTSVNRDCPGGLSTKQSAVLMASHSSFERTPDLSGSQSKLRFSRHFSESEKYTADFTGSSAVVSTYRSSFESLSDGSEVASLEEEETVTVFSAGSDADTRTCSSVSEGSLTRWNDEDGVDENVRSSQLLSSCNSSDVVSSVQAVDAASETDIPQDTDLSPSAKIQTADIDLISSVAGRLSMASVEETNFVRSRLMHLSREKWRSAAEVERARQSDRHSANTAGNEQYAELGSYFRMKIDFLMQHNERRNERSSASIKRDSQPTPLSEYNINSTVLSRLRLQNTLNRIDKSCHVHDRDLCDACRHEDHQMALVQYLTNKRAFVAKQLTNENYERHLLSLEAWVHYAQMLSQSASFATDPWTPLLKPLTDLQHSVTAQNCT